MKYGERKPIPKAMRQQVYDKYHGHCAYCGRKIEMKEMQVDHIIPIAYSCYGPRDKSEEVRKMFEDESINAIGNLMPACRACNFYKGINDIERFRNRIKSELDHTCRQSFQTRLAMQYGIIKYEPWDGKFYFEHQQEIDKDLPSLAASIERLKSLRPQNWTKEDKERYISCLQRLGTGNPKQPETINSKWFKEHVYPQSTWKPSNGQMKALKEACDEHWEPDGLDQLYTLYQDLKKLREE